MKKLLLSFLLLFPLMSMSAADCSINFSEQGYENAQEMTTVDIDNAINLVFDKGTNNNTPKYYITGSAVRLYGGNTLTVNAAEGVTINSAQFTFDPSNPIVEESEVSEGQLTISDGLATWTGEAQSFTLTEGGTKGHARIKSVTVTYTMGDAPIVANVLFSVAEGQVIAGSKLELTCATEGASIYYTTDGTEPTVESTLYADPIVIDTDMTVVAIAAKDGVQSKSTKATYTLIKEYTSLAEIVALEPQTKFICGIDLTVYESHAAYVYVYDPKNEEYALIYKYDLGLEPCNIIEAGWEGTVNVYGRLNQLVPDTQLTVSDQAGELPTVQEVNADNIADIYVAANVRKPYLLKGVKILSAFEKKSCNGSLGETEISIYNQFSIDVEGIIVDGLYDIYGIMNSYNGNLQINPVEIALAEEDPETPAVHLYDSVAETTVDEDWGETAVPTIKDIAVEVYDQYVIVRGFAGVEGYDIKVGFGEDDAVAYVTSIVNGVEGEAVTAGYTYLYTGLEDVSYMTAYLGEGYGYAGLDEDETGYVMLSCYWGDDWAYYYIYWPQEEVVVPETPIYESEGDVTATEGWGETAVPEIPNVQIEAYDDYVIIRGFAGVEGYDMKVGMGENDAVTYIASIIDGVEGESATSGYFNVPTGRDDVANLQVYISNGYCYAGLYEDESGYVLLSCYWGADWTYYYCTWPHEDEEEWVNPFEGEAEYLYSAQGETTSLDEEDWGASLFPTLTGIDIDVYDKYIYIKNIAGVAGHGAKVAYNEEEEVLSIMPVEDGVDGKPCESYTYLSTGREDVSTIQAYNDYSYAMSYDDKSGYVLLSAYLYGANDLAAWNYYYVTWTDNQSSVSSIKVSTGTAVYFDLKGNVVDKPATGSIYIRVLDGKAQKVLVK